MLDDAVNTGHTMSRATDLICVISKGVVVTKASIVACWYVKPIVALYGKFIELPAVYEWNIRHRKIASYLGNGSPAVDIDSVLCADRPLGSITTKSCISTGFGNSESKAGQDCK